MDKASKIAFAMDLTPLIKVSSLSISGWVARYINEFKADVTAKIGYFTTEKP